MLYARVVLGLPVEGPFDYIVPAQFVKKIKVGARVWVDFRAQKRLGYVVGLSPKSSIKNIKSILELIDEAPVLDKKALLLTRRIADYYCCSLGEAIETALPAALRKGKKIGRLDIPHSAPEQVRDPQITLIQDLERGDERWNLYFESIKKALADKKSAIVLLRDVHSLLSAKDKISSALGVSATVFYRNQSGELDKWLEAKEGRANVVVGTRSAIFAPLNNLGLIIIDEEEDAVYKQDQVPHYHARRVAFMRSDIGKVDLIMGAISPSLESFHLVKQNKIKYNLIPRKRPFPQIKTVPTGGFRKKSILSRYLQDTIINTVNSKGKVLLFLNRRGFATFASCSTCGLILKCPRCNINLVYHFKGNTLRCHYCNFKMSPPNICSKCNSGYIRYSGIGTEKIENELSRIFPSVKIKNLNEVVSTGSGDADVFVSTEAVIRAHDLLFELSGVLSIDNSLNRIDLSASEKTFRLLIGILALTRDKIVIQTNLSEHHVFQALLKQDPSVFYEEELRQRRQLRFPPYCHMALVKLRHKQEEKVSKAAHSLFKLLSTSCKNNRGIKVISVNPAEPAKLRDNFYWQVLIASSSARKITRFLKIYLKDFPHSGIIVTVDVDPV